MPIPRILAFMEKPSHAYTIATPAHRLVVEADNFHPQGHEIAQGVRLRKTTGAFGMMTGTEVMIGNHDLAKSEKYLNACQWWLHRAPFGVERLRLTVITHGYKRIVDRQYKTARVSDLKFFLRPQVELSKICSMFPHLREVDISYTTVTDLAPLANMRELEVFLAVRTTVRSLEPLRVLRHLKTICLSGCEFVDGPALRDVVDMLEELDLSSTNVSHADFLDSCRNLKRLDLGDCSHLRTIDRLPETVERIDLSSTGIASLEFLRPCRNLKSATFKGCRNLRSIAPLAEALMLEEIDASCTPLSDVDVLSSCRRLRRVQLEHCHRLTSTVAFGGMGALEAIDVSNTNVSNIDPFGTCPTLHSVNLSSCYQLARIDALQNVRTLVELDISGTRVSDVGVLRACQCLRTLNVSRCAFLRSLAGLAGAPVLHEVWASGSDIIDVNGLETCPNLSVLNLRETPCASLSRGV